MGTDQHETPRWMSDGNVEVDIDQLQDFANQIDKELKTNFMPGFQAGVVPMLTEAATFGMGGLKEGRFFRSAHDLSSSAMRDMLGEVLEGLMSLSGAAKVVSLEYLSGDAFAQATNDSVLAAFTRPPDPLDASTAAASGSDDGYDASKVPANPAVTGSADSPSSPASPTTDPNAGKVIGAGTAGEYSVQADDELAGPAKDPGSTGPRPQPSPQPSPTPRP